MKTKLIASLTVILAVGATSALAATAGENWENHCAKCHGADGKAETKLGKKMKLKDYSDAAAMAKFTDADLAKATAEGVKENGKEKMKGYSDKLSAEEIAALVKHIRGFAAPAK
jgi:mono/diheme cytochrome c family protein